MKDLKSQGFIEADGKIDAAIKNLKSGAKGIHSLHWELEFPEVFERENPGFDAIVGNPPFLGGNKISGTLGADYLSWLQAVHVDIDGNSDFVSYFFRLGFRLLRSTGAAGLIATNTISQGDTRRASLGYILHESGKIFEASKRYRWPGMASVIVSIVHFFRSASYWIDTPQLDGKCVSAISSFLLANNTNDDPHILAVNRGVCFRGATVVGDGFILDQCEAERLLNDDQRNSRVVLPYLGGREINSNPKSKFERYVINFGTCSLEEASKWPSLLEIAEQRVKPERDQHTGNAIALRQKKYWWRFRSDTPVLRAAVSSKKRCLAACRIGPHVSFSFQPPDQVFADSTNVFAFEAWSAFCLLQSRIHEFWARFLGSSMKDDLRYNPSDCFETFPFPECWETHSALEDSGKAYYEFRASLMIRNNEGLTKIYNRFHDPDERVPDIHKLRELHAAMDRAVLDAYGWSDIKTECDFLLDYEVDEEESSNKKKPWRYRWPDEARDEVLARLLELNAKRAKEEDISGATASKKTGKKVIAKRISKQSHTEDLF
jgi:hypothetical protein